MAEPRKRVKWSKEQNHDDVTILPHPIFDKEIDEFNQLILDWGCDHNYSETMKKYDFNTSSDDFSNVDLTLIRALLTSFVHGDRSRDGFVVGCIESGWILDVLKRLKGTSIKLFFQEIPAC